MSVTNPHENLLAAKVLAHYQANRFKHNQTVIIMNPDKDGKFDKAEGSTYEIVGDTYFEKERPNIVIVEKFEPEV